MAVLKYKDPETGEIKKVGMPSITPEDLGAAQIVTGNYIGTGTSGASNPNTLTFAFKPCLVIICSDHLNQLMFINPSEVDAFAWGSSPDVKASWGAKSVSWYSNNSDNGVGNQLNVSGKTYNYVAIG